MEDREAHVLEKGDDAGMRWEPGESDVQLGAELGEGVKVSAAHRVCKRVGRSIDVSDLGDRGEALEGRESATRRRCTSCISGARAE
jgi:hypothetical protein